MVAECAEQDGWNEALGIGRPGSEPTTGEADVERAPSSEEEHVVNALSGEKYGEAEALAPSAVESKARPARDEGAEMMRVGERPPPQTEDRMIYGGENRDDQENGGISRRAKPVLPQPRGGRVALDPARTRWSTYGTARSPRPPQGVPARLGETETNREHGAGQNSMVGVVRLKMRSSAAKAFDGASTLSLSLPLSPDPARGDTCFANANKLDGEGCRRHGLEPCALCGVRSCSPLRLSGDRSSAPSFTERARGDPCHRHLLLNCILCKMLSPAVCGDGLSPASYGRTTPHQHVLGRSTSLPALRATATSRGGGRGNGGGDGGGGVGVTSVPATAAKTAFDRVGSPSTHRCDTHDLLCCFLCGSRAKSPAATKGGDSTGSRRADGGPVLSPAPRLMLPAPTLDGCGFRPGGASSAGAFIDRSLRSSEGTAFSSVSTASQIDPVIRGGSKKEDPELCGRSILFRTPHPAGAARKIVNNGAVPTEAAFREGYVGSDVAKAADFDFVGTRPSSSQLTTPLRDGFQRRNAGSETSEQRSLAGAGTVRARRSSGKRTNHTAHDGEPIDGARANGGAPVRRSVDAVDAAVRHRQQHRSRVGTPRRRQASSKPFKETFISHDPRSSRSHRSLQGRAQENTVVGTTRAREKMGDDDLASRALTAALAVLQ